MNKTELIKSIATGSGVSHAQATRMLNTIQDVVEDALTRGNKVSIRGFGAFALNEHSARRCRHPQTGEIMTSPAYRTVRFAPSEDVRARLN